MNRKKFIKQSGMAVIGGLIIPTIVPSSVFGKNAPSNRIGIGMIGVGRQAVSANLNYGFLKLDNCQVVAINDVDSWRLNNAAKVINDAYAAKTGMSYSGVKLYDDYRELIANKGVDAVMVSTPDHWHAAAAIAAALAGKHVSVEKALSVSYSHSKALVEAVKMKGVINRLDSEFRSLEGFWKTIEIVHNNVIGKLTNVKVGVPAELSGSALGPQPEMAVPKELNYDMWLGPAFTVPYTVKRVHDPFTIETRPGWLRNEDYSNGMITNWGAHLCDVALWGMKKEYELPVNVAGTGSFSKGLWNTIESFELNYRYADGLIMNYTIDKPYVKFEGEKGWVKITYPDKMEASDPSILSYKPGTNEISYKDTQTDKADFLHAIETGTKTFEPLEVGHNVYFTTLMGLIAIRQGTELNWDNATMKFAGNSAANAMLNRPIREKWLDKNVIDWMNKFQQVTLK
jgi:myo-inositol 2-dehydrogenase / D-chiro-inositol 1-dehydrogenase